MRRANGLPAVPMLDPVQRGLARGLIVISFDFEMHYKFIVKE